MAKPTNNEYRTYSLLIVDGDFSRWIDVSAISVEAAKADVESAYGEIIILQWGVK